MSIPKSFYENIFASIAEGIMIISRERRIINLNSAAEDLLNISSAQILNHPPEDFFLNHPRLMNKIDTSLKEGRVCLDLEEKFFHPLNNEAVLLGINISPLRNELGRIVGAVLVIRDLTKLKKFREEENTSERLASISILALSLAHEIKNPLSGIKGIAQLINSADYQEDTSKYLKLIIKEVERINNLVEDLLNLSRPRKLDFKPFNIHKILERIILLEKETQKGRKIYFSQDYDPSLPPIIADQEEITRLFYNLIRNALEAISDQGTIKISSRFFTDYQLINPRGKLSRVVLIEIKDSGSGIEEKNLKEIFTPFFTTKKKGSGLGLAVAHKIVEEHRGRIKLISGKELSGTLVQVFLPLFR